MSKYVICLGKKLWHYCVSDYLDAVEPKDIVLGVIECNPKYLENNLLKFERSHNEDRGIDSQDDSSYETFANNDLVYLEV